MIKTTSLVPAQTFGINAVQYIINGEVIATRLKAPFTALVNVPAELPNGRSFEIVCKAETIWGETITSVTRNCILQGENLPTNPFFATLDVKNSWLPKPVELRVHVYDSAHAVALVEFYKYNTVIGGFDLIGKHYGPEYVLYRNIEAGR